MAVNIHYWFLSETFLISIRILEWLMVGIDSNSLLLLGETSVAELLWCDSLGLCTWRTSRRFWTSSARAECFRNRTAHGNPWPRSIPSPKQHLISPFLQTTLVHSFAPIHTIIIFSTYSTPQMLYPMAHSPIFHYTLQTVTLIIIIRVWTASTSALESVHLYLFSDRPCHHEPNREGRLHNSEPHGDAR